MDSLVVGVLNKQRCCTAAGLSSFAKGDCASYWHRRELKSEPWKTIEFPRRTCFSSIQAFSALTLKNARRLCWCEWGHGITSIKKDRTLLQSGQYRLNASSDGTYQSNPEGLHPTSAWSSIQKMLDVFYRFSRPHTVIGTTISIISVSLIAVQSISDLSPLFVAGLLKAVVPALFMNIYIVGLNQLFDIEIDKVNKPNLPLASGEYSVPTGIAIIVASACLSFSIWWAIGSWPLFWALFISFVLGTAYSINLPFLRWKQYAFIAASCILAVRAIIVQIAFFMHMQTFVFGRPAIITRPLIFATAFMSFFSVVIALFKDIPDIEGDKIFGIKSFSVTLGQKRVFWLCIYLLQMAYASAIVVGVISPCFWSKLATVLGHGMLAFILWRRAQCLNLKSKVAITSFYMFIWKLFYVEYLLIPLLR